MPKFRDTIGREWIVGFTVGMNARIKSATGFSVFAAVNLELDELAKLDDDETLAAVLWELVRDQASERGVSFESFVESLAGEVVGDALVAFREALRDFSPSPALREVWSRALKKEQEAKATALETVKKRTGELTSSASAGESPASSESIPES